jgi:hypothetical protein
MEDNKNVLYNEKEKNSVWMGLTAAVIIILLSAGSALMPDREFSEKENRELTAMPSFSVSALKDGSFSSDMEDYTADQFIFRDLWIKLRAVCETALGHYYINGVYRGDNDYLFEDISVQDSESLEKRTSALSRFAEDVDDVSVYMMIVPNAASVMPESMPAHAPVADQNAYLDSLYRGLSEKINVIDVRDTFSNQNVQLYYRTDHHWTTDGAAAAFGYMADIMGINGSAEAFERYTVSNDFRGTLESKSGFCGISPDSIEIYVPDEEHDVTYIVENTESDEKSPSVYVPEKLKTSDEYAVFFGGNYPLLHITSTSEMGKKLLIFKDSYANCFVPFLIPYYSEIFMADARYYTGDVYSLIKENAVDQVLFLYNANTFANDDSLENVIKGGFI